MATHLEKLGTILQAPLRLQLVGMPVLSITRLPDLVREHVPPNTKVIMFHVGADNKGLILGVDVPLKRLYNISGQVIHTFCGIVCYVAPEGIEILNRILN